MKRILFIANVVERSGYFVSPGRATFISNEQISVTETKCLILRETKKNIPEPFNAFKSLC